MHIDKRKKVGLIIIGCCTLFLMVLLLTMSNRKPDESTPQKNQYQDVAEAVVIPVKNSKSQAYVAGNTDKKESNIQKHWDDCGQMLEQREKERKEAGGATTEELFGPGATVKSGGSGSTSPRTYENPYRETQQEREERHRRRQEEAIQMAERISGKEQGQKEVPPAQEPAPEPKKEEVVTEVRRTSIISSLDDEVGLIGSLESDDTIFTDDGTRPFPCMFSKASKLKDGDRVSIILLEDIVVSGTLVPRNTHLMASVSLSNRLELKIASLELGGRIISVGYEAYDIDGSKGIYCPDVGNERATVRSRGTGLINSTLSSRMGRVASDVVSTGVSLLQSRDGERTVSVPAGYTFFIMKNKEQ